MLLMLHIVGPQPGDEACVLLWEVETDERHREEERDAYTKGHRDSKRDRDRPRRRACLLQHLKEEPTKSTATHCPPELAEASLRMGGMGISQQGTCQFLPWSSPCPSLKDRPHWEGKNPSAPSPGAKAHRADLMWP